STLQSVVPSLKKNEFTILENNMMSSVASSAGYMASSIFAGAVPGLYLCSGEVLSGYQLALWAGSVSCLGVFMAIPMKRQQINIGADLSLIMIGAGAIIGIRVSASLFISAIVCYGILGPWVMNQDPAWIDPSRYRQTWALWPGVGLLVASGLTMFLLRWRTI